jgi:hypothetical protein
MPQDRETAVVVWGLLALFGGIFLFGYFWYSRTYKSGVLAGGTLVTLASSLRNTESAWIQTSEVSIHGLWNPFAMSDTRVGLFAHGAWKGNIATIQFKLGIGLPETGFWGRLNSIGDAGIYHPPMTSVHLISRQQLAAKAGLDRFSGSQLVGSRIFAPLGMAPKLKRVSEDLFAYGEDAEIARFFNPSVVALVRSFPREVFGPSFEGPVIEGSELRMSWTGHETDPKVIVAAFHLLETISEGGVKY